MKPPKKQATILHPLLVRSRVGACEFCATPGWPNSDGLPVKGLTCAHIISRRFDNTRTDERNGFALCVECAQWFTEHPVRFTEWAISKIGRGLWDELVAKSNRWDRPDWTAEVARLRSELERIAEAA